MSQDGAPRRPFRFSLLLPTFVAVVASLVVHTAIPIASLAIPAPKAVSRAEMEIVRLPPSENPVDPEDEPSESKKKPTEEKVVKKKDRVKKPVKKAVKKADKDTKKSDAAKKASEKAKEATAEAPNILSRDKKRGGQIVKGTAAELAKAYRARLRAEREGRLSKLREARSRARDERKAEIEKQRAKNGVGGIPPGDPRALFGCEATTRGRQIHLRAERALSDWVAIVPTILMPFESRPSLGRYTDQITQIVKRGRSGIRRVGAVEMALPGDVLQLPLESPRGARLAVGHLDGRCLVGFNYDRKSKDLFPITLSRVPIRILHKGKSSRALVDFTLQRDARFTWKLHKGVDDVGALPFPGGRLKNGDGIQRTIADHINAAKALTEVASWFGIDVKKMTQENQRKRLKKTVKTVSNAPKKTKPPKSSKRTPKKTSRRSRRR